MSCFLFEMYSAEEIEKKRQLALQKKKEKEKLFNNCQSPGPSVTSKSILNNHTNRNVPSYSGNQGIQKYLNNFPGSNAKFSSHNQQSIGTFKNKSESSFKKMGSQNRYNPLQKSTQKFYGSQPSSEPVCEIICSMISNDRFIADMTLFTPQVIDLFKTIPTRIYGNYSKLIF